MVQPLVTIGTAAQETGLTPDNIRVWERRYQAVTPKRAKGGRLFSQADVRRLRHLKQAVSLGHNIGQVANLNDADLERLVQERAFPAQNTGASDVTAVRHLDAIMAHANRYDAIAADRILGKLAALMAPRQFAYEVMLPLMKRVGDAWAAGTIDEAQEHLISNVLRAVTTTMLRQHFGPTEPAQKMIFSTPEGELHEFGILVASILTLAAGLGVIYLGPNLPAKAIVKAAQKTGAKAVVLGLGPCQDLRDDTLSQLDQIRGLLDSDCQLILGGGPNTAEFAEQMAKRQIHYPRDFEGFERLL